VWCLSRVNIAVFVNTNNLPVSCSDEVMFYGFVCSEPKPVKCHVCDRGFKNIAALNGHMRLHGGYVRKVCHF